MKMNIVLIVSLLFLYGSDAWHSPVPIEKFHSLFLSGRTNGGYDVSNDLTSPILNRQERSAPWRNGRISENGPFGLSDSDMENGQSFYRYKRGPMKGLFNQGRTFSDGASRGLETTGNRGYQQENMGRYGIPAKRPDWSNDRVYGVNSDDSGFYVSRNTDFQPSQQRRVEGPQRYYEDYEGEGQPQPFPQRRLTGASANNQRRMRKQKNTPAPKPQEYYQQFDDTYDENVHVEPLTEQSEEDYVPVPSRSPVNTYGGDSLEFIKMMEKQRRPLSSQQKSKQFSEDDLQKSQSNYGNKQNRKESSSMARNQYQRKSRPETQSGKVYKFKYQIPTVKVSVPMEQPEKQLSDIKYPYLTGSGQRQAVTSQGNPASNPNYQQKPNLDQDKETRK